jgi:hypothetical protein
MSEQQDLDTLSRLVDVALQLAVQIDQKTIAYLLSMVSVEISSQIKTAKVDGSPEIDGQQ